VRKLIRAPAPMSTTSVLIASVHSAAFLPAISIGTGRVPGTLNGIHVAFASRNHVSSAAKPAAIPSAAA